MFELAAQQASHRVALRVLAGVLALTATGCSSESDGADDDFLGGTWSARQFPEDPRYPESQVQPPNPLARLTFNPDGKWTATDGCNDLNGEYDVADDGSDFESSTGLLTGVGCVSGNVPWDRLLGDTEKIVLKDDGGTADFLSSTGDLIVQLSLEGEANAAIVMPSPTDDSPLTPAGGTLAVRQGCLTLNSMLVMWPYGTTWASWADTVHVPDGKTARIGSQVYGEGVVRQLSLTLPTSWDDAVNARIRECQSKTGLARLAILYTVDPKLRP